MEPTTAVEQAEFVAATCKALFFPSQVVELAVLGINRKEGHNGYGWFNDHEALCEAALKYDQSSQPNGVYVTVNPLHEACLARTNNRLVERHKTRSSDADVSSRQWLFVDLDCVRPAGTSSSNAEIGAAIDTAKRILEWMEGTATFPRGYRALSGNGVHLLWRIDAPNDDPSKRLIQRVLTVLNRKFSNDQVKIDVGNVNAGRLIRLHGTRARKGASTEDRPHRVSRPWTIAGEFPTFADTEIVPAHVLAHLADLGRPAARPRRRSKSAGVELFDLNAFIERHRIAVRSREPFDGTGERIVLEHCVFDETHAGSSAALGRTGSGNIFYKCHHDSCRGRGWQQVRERFESTAKKTTKPSRRSSDTRDSAPEDPWSLAREFIEQCFYDYKAKEAWLVRHREQWFKYDRRTKRYVQVSNDNMKVLVTRTFGPMLPSITNRKVGDVLNCVSSMVTVPDECEIPFSVKIDIEESSVTVHGQNENRIALRNGLLDIDAVLAGNPVGQCLKNHTATWFNTSSLPFPFPVSQADADCPAWIEFLEQIFESDQDRIKIMQEAFGYCFMADTRFETFFVLMGIGRNGKSTCLSVLRRLLGDENVASLTPDQLANSYMLATLADKLANLCPDMGEVDRVEEGILKALVSGDPITADRKYKSPLQFAARATLFFATNVLPRFSDVSLGIWRRMVVIPFNYIVPIDDTDPFLLDRLNQELPGILLWALQGAARLSLNKRFTESTRCVEAARNYRLSCFPILTFLDECTRPSGYVGAHGLWKVYRAWCVACGLSKPKPLHPFIADVQRFRPEITDNRDETRRDMLLQLYGISVEDDLDLGEEEAPPPRRPDESRRPDPSGDQDQQHPLLPRQG